MDTMNADCMGILSAAIVQEYNTIHNSDDYTLVEASFTTETFIPPETNGDETGLGYVNFLVRPIRWNTSWGKHQGYLEHRCRLCNPDNDGLATTAHGLFESNVLATLKASSCEAFGVLTDIGIVFTFGNSITSSE
jgi:hypothetical protein